MQRLLRTSNIVLLSVLRTLSLPAHLLASKGSCVLATPITEAFAPIRVLVEVPAGPKTLANQLTRDSSKNVRAVQLAKLFRTVCRLALFQVCKWTDRAAPAVAEALATPFDAVVVVRSPERSTRNRARRKIGSHLLGAQAAQRVGPTLCKQTGRKGLEWHDATAPTVHEWSAFSNPRIPEPAGKGTFAGSWIRL